jgi:hypothetical protein
MSNYPRRVRGSARTAVRRVVGSRFLNLKSHSPLKLEHEAGACPGPVALHFDLRLTQFVSRFFFYR